MYHVNNTTLVKLCHKYNFSGHDLFKAIFNRKTNKSYKGESLLDFLIL